MLVFVCGGVFGVILIMRVSEMVMQFDCCGLIVMMVMVGSRIRRVMHELLRGISHRGHILSKSARGCFRQFCDGASLLDIPRASPPKDLYCSSIVHQ